jgi:hypothetical protein
MACRCLRESSDSAGDNLSRLSLWDEELPKGYDSLEPNGSACLSHSGLSPQGRGSVSHKNEN